MNKERYIFNIIESFCNEPSVKRSDLSIFNDFDCDKVVKYINNEDDACTKECYIYQLIDDNIDDIMRNLLEHFVSFQRSEETVFHETKDDEIEIEDNSVRTYFHLLKEILINNISYYNDNLRITLKDILIKLYKRDKLIKSLKSNMNKYISDDDEEQDRYLYEKIAKQYPINVHSSEKSELFSYDKGILEYFYAVYMANFLINEDDIQDDKVSFLCERIQKSKKVKSLLSQIHAKFPGIKSKHNYNDDLTKAINVTTNESVKQRAIAMKDNYSHYFRKIPFYNKVELVEKIYSLIKNNESHGNAMTFMELLSQGTCEVDKAKYTNKVDLTVDRSEVREIEKALDEQLDFSSEPQNTIIGRFMNKFTNVQTIQNALRKMRVRSERTTIGDRDSKNEYVEIEGSVLRKNKMESVKYKWKKFDRYLNPEKHRSSVNIFGRMKKPNKVKGGLEIKVLYKNNVYEGKLWRGPTGDSDDAWKQNISEGGYYFTVDMEINYRDFKNALPSFPKNTLVYIPSLSSRSKRGGDPKKSRSNKSIKLFNRTCKNKL